MISVENKILKALKTNKLNPEILGERIKIAIDKEMPIEDRKKESELSQTISSLAKQMINNADIVLRTNKLVADGTLKNTAIEKMIGE